MCRKLKYDNCAPLEVQLKYHFDFIIYAYLQITSTRMYGLYQESLDFSRLRNQEREAEDNRYCLKFRKKFTGAVCSLSGDEQSLMT